MAIDKKELTHSIGAAFVMIVAFILCAYVVVPMFLKFMAWFGFYFVPERIGGGSEIGNESFLQLAFRGIFSLVVSGYASFIAGAVLFPSQSTKATLISAGTMVVVFFVSVFGYSFFVDKSTTTPPIPVQPVMITETLQPLPVQAPMSSAAPPIPAAEQPLPTSAPIIISKAVTDTTPPEPKKHQYKPVKRVYLIDGSYIQCRSAILAGNKVRIETVMQDIVEFNPEEINLKRTFKR